MPRLSFLSDSVLTLIGSEILSLFGNFWLPFWESFSTHWDFLRPLDFVALLASSGLRSPGHVFAVPVSRVFVCPVAGRSRFTGLVAANAVHLSDIFRQNLYKFYISSATTNHTGAVQSLCNPQSRKITAVGCCPWTTLLYDRLNSLPCGCCFIANGSCLVTESLENCCPGTATSSAGLAVWKTGFLVGSLRSVQHQRTLLS
jgi:hypothetical protein